MINLATKKGNFLRINNKQPEYIDNLKRSLDEVANNLPSVNNTRAERSSKTKKSFK